MPNVGVLFQMFTDSSKNMTKCNGGADSRKGGHSSIPEISLEGGTMDVVIGSGSGGQAFFIDFFLPRALRKRTVGPRFQEDHELLFFFFVKTDWTFSGRLQIPQTSSQAQLYLELLKNLP